MRKSLVLCMYLTVILTGCGGSDSAVVTVTVDPDTEEVLLEDNFPGYAEDPDWDDHWTMGIGELNYNSDNPGFVRLLLDGPGAGGTYHNAEKKHYGETGNRFLYCDLEIRLRNNNNNGLDAPGAPGTPDPEYGLGSRGWGFWNDQMELEGANVIWFTSISPDSDSQFIGTQVWIVLDGKRILTQDLNIDLTQWHTYRIQWRVDYLSVFIDDMDYPIAEITDENSIPFDPLVFTVWIDNSRFTGDFSSPSQSFLPFPDIEQYLDIDYIRIYRP